MDYKTSGVDIEAGREFVSEIKQAVEQTHTSNVIEGIGGFGGLFRIPLDSFKKPVLVSGTDGVGTKLELAQSKNGYIGFDNASQVWITGKDTNNFTHKLRSKVDGIIVGRRTAEIDNPRLTVRSVLGPNPVRVIADTNRKLPLNLKLFNDNAAYNIVLCS